MKIYKEKQFLVFDFEDGSTVKYDFATKKAIGKKGKPVVNLCSQLRGLTINQLCDCCTDEKYGNFLRFVRDQESYRSREINNIGTILSRVPHFSNFEQLFSAGINDIVDRNFSYTINDIPKGLIKLCRKHKIKLSNNFLKFYKRNPDGYLLAYNSSYTSLDDKDIYDILSYSTSVREYYGDGRYDYTWSYVALFNYLIDEYGYTVKGLLNYLDYLKTFEAIDDMGYALREIQDYTRMMKEISPKFDKYPRHFLTTHKIAARNYNRLKEKFVEEDFKKRINKEMEHTFDDYCFIYPKCTQDIKDEAVQQNNCVASYIKRVINGECHIMFLRLKSMPDESLVTIEVRNNKIVQALQKFNHPLTKKQQEIVDRWNKWWINKINNKNESEGENYVD